MNFLQVNSRNPPATWINLESVAQMTFSVDKYNKSRLVLTLWGGQFDVTDTNDMKKIMKELGIPFS